MNKKIIELLVSLNSNSQVFYNTFQIDGYNCHILYFIGLSDINTFNDNFLKRISKNNIEILDKIFNGTFKKTFDVSKEQLSLLLFKGNILLYVEEINILYNLELKSLPERAITSSNVDPENVYEAKDGFVETTTKNIAMIQSRIKTSIISIDKYYIGKYTNTEVSVLYIENLIEKHNLDNVKKKLESLHIDSLLAISDIEFIFNENSLVPLITQTGSPRLTSDSLLSGKIIILIDQIPLALILPIDLKYLTKLNEDSSAPHYYLIYNRILTYILLFISIFALGIYLAIINYHYKNIALSFISDIKSSSKGINIPVYLEVIITLFIFEFLKLASTRTPSTNLQNVVIVVGGLLIGQNTVSSGFVSSFNLVVIAISYLSAYAVTNNQHFIVSIALMRYFILIGSLFLGLFGCIVTSSLVLIYLYRQKSINTPYLTPILPFKRKELSIEFISKYSYNKKKENKQ